MVGSTNRLGEYAKDRPVTFGDVFATLYTSLGLNPDTTNVLDPTGRPQHLSDQEPLTIRHVEDKDLWIVRFAGKTKAGDKTADQGVEAVFVGHAGE